MFFKGQLVPVELSSINELNAKPQFSLFKSATKFRVLMLKMKKSKVNMAEKTDLKHEEPQNKPNQSQSKLFMVKLKKYLKSETQKYQNESDSEVLMRNVWKSVSLVSGIGWAQNESQENEDLSEPKRRNVFGSGQAVGGHKRSHFVAKIAESLVAKKCGKSLIDFNLPAPIEVDDFSTQLEVSAVSDVESVN
ncbi:hypothetical protein Acr_23g0008880 [Actinidia rufa]|uniref:Uncharacterized protein n=1 Tax=Actinidia rufa TaxID=165716 RepID=A0A7J0GNZ6_9ERIC|nr:hypothetical protein Acr_23g0008880 [Actinidia rufa]